MTIGRLTVVVALLVLFSDVAHAQLRVERASIDQFKTQSTRFDLLTRQAFASTTNSASPNDITVSFSLANEATRMRDRLRDLEVFLSLYSVFPRPPSINPELDGAVRRLVSVQLGELAGHVKRSLRLMDGMATKTEDKQLVVVIQQVRNELNVTDQLVSQLAPQ